MTLDRIAENEIDNNVVPIVSKLTFMGSIVPDFSSDVQHTIPMEL